MKELTREKALELHRQMWSDMQKEFVDCPTYEQRKVFKARWCLEHTPETRVYAYCYLCEYMNQIGDGCSNCPINWGEGTCVGDKVNYHRSPISEILALPERKEN